MKMKKELKGKEEQCVFNKTTQNFKNESANKIKKIKINKPQKLVPLNFLPTHPPSPFIPVQLKKDI